MPSEKNDPSSSDCTISAFDHVFANLPGETNQRLNALVTINGLFRSALAKQLQPIVRMLLQESPPADVHERRELARRLNYVLCNAGLAIRNPKSGQPSTIVAEPYRLVLQSRAAKDAHRTRSGNIKTLPPLELIEHMREESFRTWQQKIKDDEPHERDR